MKFPASSKHACLCPSRLLITVSYQHISFFPILARALQGKNRILSSFLRGKKRLIGIGLPHYRGFCKSRNNVATQDLGLSTQAPPGTQLLCQQPARVQAAVLVSRWPDKSTHSETQPPLPRRCTYFRWPVQICKERCIGPRNTIHLLHTMAPQGHPAQPAKLKNTFALIWIPSANTGRVQLHVSAKDA